MALGLIQVVTFVKETEAKRDTDGDGTTDDGKHNVKSNNILLVYDSKKWIRGCVFFAEKLPKKRAAEL